MKHVHITAEQARKLKPGLKIRLEALQPGQNKEITRLNGGGVTLGVTRLGKTLRYFLCTHKVGDTSGLEHILAQVRD